MKFYKNWQLMDYMLMAAFIMVIMAFTGVAHAQDSGLYYNPERDGEGINLIRNKDTVVFYFYTYEPNEGCWNIEIPESGLVTEENCNEQRWFLCAGDALDAENSLEVWVFIGLGLQ